MTPELGQAALAKRICSELAAAVPGSECALRGSLASGNADQWSDIDVRWQVPDDAFQKAVAGVSDTLGRVARISSLRVDPDFARSERRRLLYLRFAGVPIFWRVDVEVVARSVADDDAYDRANPAARDDSEWSRYESALLNGVAALKAIYRGNERLATELLARGAARAGISQPETASHTGVVDYAERIAMYDRNLRGLADELIAAAQAEP